eukprot:1259041-Rhodomonas_salina.1
MTSGRVAYYDHDAAPSSCATAIQGPRFPCALDRVPVRKHSFRCSTLDPHCLDRPRQGQAKRDGDSITPSRHNSTRVRTVRGSTASKTRGEKGRRRGGKQKKGASGKNRETREGSGRSLELFTASLQGRRKRRSVRGQVFIEVRKMAVHRARRGLDLT